MEGIHPASLAMLGILFVVALVGAAELAIGRLRQRRAARRSQRDVVIDLTYMHEAIRRDREQAERLRAAALNERRSTSPGGGGR